MPEHLSHQHMQRSWRRMSRVLVFAVLVALIGGAFWFYASLTEAQTGRRLWPWSAYALCGHSTPDTLPPQVRIGLYEEFPNPWRLEKLRQLDFPVTLAIAARSASEYEQLRASILQEYPQVREVYFWPLLADEEGYYPGAWSAAPAVQRITREAQDVPVLWDLETPRGVSDLRTYSLANWWQNRATLAAFFAQHEQPVHTWRSYVSMGLNPAFLRLVGMHYDPTEYPNLWMHLDLYTTGSGQDSDQLYQMIRCGVERYGTHFIPSLGVLNDGEGPAEIFVPVDTFRRNLLIARQAGVSEVWIFGANGLNPAYLRALHDTLPLEPAQIHGS